MLPPCRTPKKKVVVCPPSTIVFSPSRNQQSTDSGGFRQPSKIHTPRKRKHKPILRTPLAGAPSRETKKAYLGVLGETSISNGKIRTTAASTKKVPSKMRPPHPQNTAKTPEHPAFAVFLTFKKTTKIIFDGYITDSQA
jgi:hypothetical protein